MQKDGAGQEERNTLIQDLTILNESFSGVPDLENLGNQLSFLNEVFSNFTRDDLGGRADEIFSKIQKIVDQMPTPETINGTLNELRNTLEVQLDSELDQAEARVQVSFPLLIDLPQ